ITERKLAEEKVQHLNLVLRTIRNVNQLIVEEKNRDALIQKACKIMTENRGYKNAWIVLLGENGEYLSSAESGLGISFNQLKKMLEKGELPNCGSKTLKNESVVIIEDPSKECVDCPLSAGYGGRSGFSIRLVYGDKTYGQLTVSSPGFIIGDKEEQGLFREIGGDIGFALHNIEAKKKSEKAEAQLKLQSLALESAANAIVITDAEGQIQWTNPAFSTLTGYSVDEALERNPRILKSGQHDEKFYKNIWNTITAGEVWHGEIINKRKDGELYTEEMTIAPLLSEEKEISNYIAIKQDITERVQAEKEIRQRTEDLTLINTINNAVNQGKDLPEILMLLNEEAKRVFNSKSTAVYLFTRDQKYLELQNITFPPKLVKRIEKLIGISIPDIRIPVEEGSFTKELLMIDGPRLINDSETIKKWMLEFTGTIQLSEKSRAAIRKLISQIYKLVDIQSLITVPMISAGELIGLMDFSRREPFTEEDTKRVAVVTGQVTAAITSLRAEKEKARSRRLLLTLSQAAPAVQRASTPAEIFRALGEQVVKMGFDVTVFTLNDDKKHLTVSYHSLKADWARTIEKLTSLSVKNHSFPLKPNGYYHQIITNGETVFNHLDIEPIEEALPQPLRPLAKKMMDLFSKQRSIFVPLSIKGEVRGILSFSGTDLNESDIPAIKTFANQAAIALEKTRLFNEIQELATFNESIVQSMAEGIVLQDTEGFFTFANPAAVSMLGYTAEEWAGMHWKEIVPPDQHSPIQAADERRVRGESDNYELDLIGKDGQQISVLLSGSPRFDAEDHFEGTIGVFTDITERKRAEEEIQQHVRRLDALRIVDQAIMGSFELNVTLNVILEQLLVQLEIDASAVLSYQEDL
ncbi:MAG: PAS domain S-box protein, partial [Desulfobacteraceae bacterium]|nr:PAS domain S-box protein [Desulfobacteraceae bacterium]